MLWLLHFPHWDSKVALWISMCSVADSCLAHNKNQTECCGAVNLSCEFYNCISSAANSSGEELVLETTCPWRVVLTGRLYILLHWYTVYQKTSDYLDFESGNSHFNNKKEFGMVAPSRSKGDCNCNGSHLWRGLFILMKISVGFASPHPIGGSWGVWLTQNVFSVVLVLCKHRHCQTWKWFCC